MKALRSARFLVLLAAAFFSTILAAGLLLAAPAPPRVGGTGSVLALRSALHALASAHPKTFQSLGVPTDLKRASDGRYIYDKRTLMRSGALRGRVASATAQVNEAVQTFDVFNAPPTFAPGAALTPTNLTPVWTADETMLVFSSNRTATGGVQTDGSFHIWAIPINGGTPIQLTSSTVAAGANSALPHGEFFPTLSANNNQELAFTSDANSVNVQNLYVTALTPGTVYTVVGQASPTIRVNSAGNSLTGFANVGRPAFSPSNPDQILFAATSTTGTYAGRSHIYYLYVSTGGFDSGTLSFPAKITDGPSDDTDPAYSQDGLAIAFSSTATALTATNQAASSDPNTSLIATSTPAATRSIFVIGGGGAFGFGTIKNGGAPVTTPGTDNYGPAWSSSKGNPYTNPATGQEYIAFARGGTTQAAPHDIYYLQTLQNNTAGVAQLLPESGTNAAVKLNTDDASNAYDDIYPTWSPFSTVYSLAYSSNRTVTYNDPSTGLASETAISVPESGSLGSGITVGASYAGLLESQLLNLDPPTLLPYSGNEIVHIANSAGLTTRYGITPGQPVTITVRLSNREAGIDDSNVYVQIKDPDSKYQDAQGLEHKVFAKDTAYRTQTNAPLLLDSGTSALLMNGGGYLETVQTATTPPTTTTVAVTFDGYNQFPASGGGLFDTINRGSVAGIEGGLSFLSGTAISSTTAPQNGTPVGSISIGHSGGGTNAETVATKDGKPVTDGNTKTVVVNPPGSDPTLFTPWGPEFECQVVNPAFGSGGDTDTGQNPKQPDYRDPYYLAGVDDQQPYSSGGKARPIADGTDAAGNATPAEWLKLTRAPQQDGQGGVLYTVNWTTPASGSDYYLDVIAFDKATAPATYSAYLLSTQGITTAGGNWRIYDNVWGFSTASSIGSNDILVVNDYASGQKFAATTFGGQRGLLNLIPKLYSAESYVTDIDVNLLPTAIYRHFVITGADQNNPNTEVIDFGNEVSPAGGQLFANAPLSPFLNGLGVGSYSDPFIDDGNTRDGVPSVASQQYSLWRILARGPVPDSVYKLYEPTIVTQPAVADTAGKVTIAAGQTAIANRCILWLSPFTGDVLAGAGTLSDTATQNSLRSFVKAGGRLCVSGQDVGSALTQNGTANNTAGGFLPDVLNATLLSSSGGTHEPAPGTVAADHRLTYSPSYDLNLVGTFEELNAGANTISPVAMRDRPIRISNNYGRNFFVDTFVNDLRNLGNWRTDGSLDQLGPYVEPFSSTPLVTVTAAGGVTEGSLAALFQSNSVVSQIDTVTPGATAHTDLTLAPFANQVPPVQFGNDAAASAPGGAGLIYTDNTFSTTGGNGSKVVYATFGLEGLSAEVYKRTDMFKPNGDIYEVRNVRQGLIHNIVSYLRTGTITGTVRSTSGNGTSGAAVAGATVYLASALGPAIPGRGTFSALTDGSGNFSIGGIEPGSYTLVAYKDGYLRATSNPGVVFVVEGDTTQQASLTLAQAPPGTITGQVTDTSKNPIAGASVVFTASDGQTKSATTDTNGNYTLASIPPGSYTGTAAKTGSGSATQTATLPSGGSITVNFTLTPGPGTATGRVVNTAGTPIAGATVFFNGGTTPIPTATTASDGTYTLANLAAGTYVVTASDLPTYGLSAPLQPNVIIVSTQTTAVPDIILGAVTNGTLGGLVTAAGSTTPLAGVTITVVNTANSQSVTATTSGTASTGGDGSPANYSLTLGQGTYTVTATQNGISAGTQTITISGTGFFRVDFAGTGGLPSVHTFPAGIQFVSAPYDYSSLGFDTLFGTLNTAATGTTPNGNRSHVAVWNPTTLSYALDPTAPADKPRPGFGYWVYLKNSFQVNQAGGALTGTVSVSLTPNWNQIGVPSLTGIPVANLKFTAGGQLLSFADASSSQYHAISNVLYRYDGSTYQRVLSTDTLQPWQAYWILAYTPVTLNIPTGK